VFKINFDVKIFDFGANVCNVETYFIFQKQVLIGGISYFRFTKYHILYVCNTIIQFLYSRNSSYHL
jgi:hypothetical protein